MKAQISLAVLLSVVLIGGATWFRFSTAKTSDPQLIVVGNKDINEVTVDEFFGPISPDTPSSSSLSETELMSRKLFSDYINLRAGGQVTSENLGTLAEQYAADLLKEGGTTNIPTATKNQLIIIPDSNQALIDYNFKILKMRAKYESLIKSLGVEKDFSDFLGPEFSNFMLSVSATYEQAVEELKKTPVPASLSDNHLDLINNYLSSLRATLSISKIEENPISALAALNTQAKNSEEEEALIANIKVFLMSKGLYTNNL